MTLTKTQGKEADVTQLTPDEAKLLTILTYRRPHDDAFTAQFVEKYIASVGATKLDEVGNYGLLVRNDDGTDPETMFSCHYDTVHGIGKIQKVCYDPTLRMAYKDDEMPLGADDGAGVWLLLYLLKHGVPGLYLWHAGEEKGCIGSKYLASQKPEWLTRIKRAIAFDRRDTTHIITHQGGERGCSKEFAEAFAVELNKTGLKYAADPTGLYTDTREYFDLIPECTNISVGYEGEHSKSEMLDVGHVMKLAEVLVTIDFEKLPVKRDHTAPAEYEYDHYGYGYGYNYGSGYVSGKKPKYSNGYSSNRCTLEYEDLVELCNDSPHTAAMLISNFGATQDDWTAAEEDYFEYASKMEDEDDDEDKLNRPHGWNLN